MAGIRDDSAGNYGQWDSSDLSWLDFIKATGSDVGNGAYNALSNITGALSPIGTSPEGNMSLQVPPMITGIADSYRRLSDPTGPGNAYRLTGVPELDAPIQKDMSDVLLSFTGGQAIGGLGRSALPKRGMNRIERTVTDYDFPMYRMTDNAGTEIARAQFDELPNAVRVKDLFVDPSHRGQGVASTLYGHIQDDLVKPMTPDYTLTPDGFEFWKNSYPEAVADYRFDGQTYRQPGPLRAGAETGAVESYRMSGGPNRDSNVLWSDTGRPSIFGSAAATAGEQHVAAANSAAHAPGLPPFERPPMPEVNNGLVFNIDRNGPAPVVTVKDGDRIVGSSYFDELPDAIMNREIYVDSDYRRQGLASRMYGYMQDQTGKPLTPDKTMTPDGYEFWKSSYPEAVKRHEYNGEWVDKSGVDLSKGVPEWRMSGGPNRDRNVLWSDTGRPSIFGSALATAGEQQTLPDWLKF